MKLPRLPGGTWRTRRLLPAVALLLAAAAFVASVDVATKRTAPDAGVLRRFREAGRAYEAGRPGEAAKGYAALVADGHRSREVFFNLGNAHAADGRPGRAVLNYRKAWRLAPRDPDVAANLRLVLRATGAAEPDLTGPEIAFTSLSEREWAAAAVVGWWLGWALAALTILPPPWKWHALGVAAVCWALAALALAGCWSWGRFDRHPELVVQVEARSALQAPAATAAPVFPLREGSVVRQRGTQGAWVEVASGQLTGWLPSAAVTTVRLDAPE